MAAIPPSIIAEGDFGYTVLRAEGVAADDYLEFETAKRDPSKYRLMRVAVSSGTPGADKIRFMNRADGMTATLHLESAGQCLCPDAVNECGFLRNPGRYDTVTNLTGGGTVTLVVELIP